MVPPTAITGSYPRPLWFDRSLDGRSFKAALGDSLFREQYLDAVAAIINAQEAAGLDIVTDGDSRFDLVVGGKSWFFYPIERLERALPEMTLDLCDIMNAEFRELAASGCPAIQVEEPRHHGLTTRPDCSDAELEFQTAAFNRQLDGVDAEIWVHTCWGNPTISSGFIGRCRAMSGHCHISYGSMPTSSPSNAPATTARI